MLDIKQAMAEAQNRGLDLVMMSPNANPPVCKIIDYGKYKYQQEKKKKDNKKASKQKDMKEIRFGLKIGNNDLEIKMKKVREFLIDGHKVKVSATFKGREMAHRAIGYQVLEKAIEKLEGISITEQPPTMAGRRLSMTIRGDAKAIKEYLAEQPQEEKAKTKKD